MLTYQPFIGGAAPLYPDYIVFGAFQWVRVMSPYQMLAEGDPVADMVRALPRSPWRARREASRRA